MYYDHDRHHGYYRHGNGGTTSPPGLSRKHDTGGQNRSNAEIVEERKKNNVRGSSGLQNIGNTCYMNSILQCLTATDPLRSYIISEKFHKPLIRTSTNKLAKKVRKKLNLKDNDQVRLKGHEVEQFCENTITHQLYRLMSKMWSGNKTITPRSFKQIIGRYNPEFAGFRQNDSQELLNLIIDTLHEDMCGEVKVSFSTVPRIEKIRSNCAKIIADPDSTPQQKHEAKVYFREYKRQHPEEFTILESYVFWKQHIHKSHSVITDLFTGLFCSQITCSECNNISSTFDPFTILSLQIPQQGTATLSECLQNFGEAEQLTGENQYKCDVCKTKVDATKKMAVWQPPEILIIQLKRFKHMQYRTNKISTEIDFPINGLTLGEVYSELHPRNDYVYDLYAVSDHLGGYGGGHYTATCKNSINTHWYKFDDNRVYHVPNEHVQSTVVTSNAYILFYKRRQVNLDDSDSSSTDSELMTSN